MPWHGRSVEFLLEPDELDHVLEREAVERYVTRLRRGDLTEQPSEAGGYPAPQPAAGGASHWDMDVINANWAALFAAPNNGRSTMTTDQYTYRAANAMPNHEPDPVTMTVEDIMRERGVGKRYAYELLKRKSEEQNTVEVSENQRERVLAILWRTGAHNSTLLKEALHKDGYEINGHDTVKVLWSLQKTGHVKFRERQSPRMLFAIRLTDLGKADGRKYATEKKKSDFIDQELEALHPRTVDARLAEAIEDNRRKSTVEAVEEAYGVKYAEATEGQPEPVVPWFRDNMGGWPAMRDVRDRYNKAVKIRAAATLLEEVGEDDTVLALLDKVTFTPLEEEVVQLLRFLKEIE